MDYIDVSIILPVYNGVKWIGNCFNSILEQTALLDGLRLELSIFDDCSADGSFNLLTEWKSIFEAKGIKVVLGRSASEVPRGVGFAKNCAVNQSRGQFLCFQDVDDVMLPERIRKQYNVALNSSNSIIGCKFKRAPPDSTVRFSNWANNLPQSKLCIQIYTSHGPTVIMPTWFCKRDLFYRVGSFSEEGRGVPEDLIFFYKHLRLGGTIKRVDDVLLIYTYHAEATTFSVSSKTIWTLRVREMEENFLSKCLNGFTIWNAGKEGRQLARSLSSKYREKILCLCDVDVKKIGKKYEMYCPNERKVLHAIPIIHFSMAKSPFIICVKMDMTAGQLENNIQNLHIREGIDYIMFN